MYFDVHRPDLHEIATAGVHFTVYHCVRATHGSDGVHCKRVRMHLLSSLGVFFGDMGLVVMRSTYTPVWLSLVNTLHDIGWCTLRKCKDLYLCIYLFI